MIEGLDLNQRIEFISEYDKGEQKTVFIFRPLSGSEKINVSSIYNRGTLKLTGDFLLGLIKSAVVEVKNPNFDKEKDKDALMNYLDKLPSKVLIEFGGKIQDMFELTENDQKN